MGLQTQIFFPYLLSINSADILKHAYQRRIGTRATKEIPEILCHYHCPYLSLANRVTANRMPCPMRKPIEAEARMKRRRKGFGKKSPPRNKRLSRTKRKYPPIQ